MSDQVPGHIFGPRVPSLAFWYGGLYLGEVRFPFLAQDPVAAAKAQVGRALQFFYPGPEGSGMLRRLDWATPRVYY